MVAKHIPLHHQIHEAVKSTFWTFYGWCFHIIFALIVFCLVWYCNNVHDFVGAIRLQVARIRQDQAKKDDDRDDEIEGQGLMQLSDIRRDLDLRRRKLTGE
jgi:hypothetical protein